MPIRRPMLSAVFATALVGLCPLVAQAQLSSRPAEDWIGRLNRPERLERIQVDDVVAGLGLKPGDVVADLGAGGGAFEPALSRAVGPTGRVYAVEIDQGFVDYIDELAREQGLDNVQSVLGEFTDPGLGDVKVDVAMFHDVLHHVEKRAEYMQNLEKYLKPTGRVAVIELNKEDPETSHRDEPELQVGKEELDAWMKAIGFHRIQEHTFLGISKWYLIYGRD